MPEHSEGDWREQSGEVSLKGPTVRRDVVVARASPRAGRWRVLSTVRARSGERETVPAAHAPVAGRAVMAEAAVDAIVSTVTRRRGRASTPSQSSLWFVSAGREAH